MLPSEDPRAYEVLKALSYEYSRKIVLSIISKSAPVEEICKRVQIPMSTCYRRIHALTRRGLVRPEKTIISEDGKRFVLYKSSFKDVSINLEFGGSAVDLVANMTSERVQQSASSSQLSDTPVTG